MERLKNDKAKARPGENIAAVLLVLAEFKTLGQFNVFPRNPLIKGSHNVG
jgi:hypothetical protein